MLGKVLQHTLLSQSRAGHVNQFDSHFFPLATDSGVSRGMDRSGHHITSVWDGKFFVSLTLPPLYANLHLPPYHQMTLVAIFSQTGFFDYSAVKVRDIVLSLNTSCTATATA